MEKAVLGGYVEGVMGTYLKLSGINDTTSFILNILAYISKI